MTDNVYLKTIDRLEPDIAIVDRDADKAHTEEQHHHMNAAKNRQAHAESAQHADPDRQ